jgi:RNA polymerase sigma-70 factor (ECF subfamily)
MMNGVVREVSVHRVKRSSIPSAEPAYRSIGHLAKIQEPQALAVWLYTVTRNRFRRLRRKSADASRRTCSLDELMRDDTELGPLLQDAAGGGGSHELFATAI